MGLPSREYTLDDVHKHQDPEDLWMIIYNNVYNVTSFSAAHPGGAEVLFDCGGADATAAFDDVGHSKVAVDMLQPFLVGVLPKHQRKSYPHLEMNKPEPAPKPRRRKQKKKESIRYGVVVLLILALLAVMAFMAIQRCKWVALTR